MKLNDGVLKEIFAKYNETEDPILYHIYGAVTASAGELLLLGYFAALKNRYYLIGVSKKLIVLIRLGMLGKPVETSVIPLEKIRKVKISGWMFGMGRKIYLTRIDGSKIRLKAYKRVAKLKTQKENLDGTCNLLSALKNG